MRGCDGWHPQCFCFVTPVLVDEDEMLKMNEAFMQGEKYTPKGERITEYPADMYAERTPTMARYGVN